MGYDPTLGRWVPDAERATSLVGSTRPSAQPQIGSYDGLWGYEGRINQGAREVAGNALGKVNPRYIDASLLGYLTGTTLSERQAREIRDADPSWPFRNAFDLDNRLDGGRGWSELIDSDRLAADAGRLELREGIPVGERSYPSAFGPGATTLGDTTGTPSGDDDRRFLQGTYERYRAMVEDQKAAFLDSVRGDYMGRIKQLEDELARYGDGIDSVNKIYGDYADDAEKILAAAASVEANPLPTNNIDKVITDTYDSYGEALAGALGQMNANGNPELAKAMGSELRRFEFVIASNARAKALSDQEMHDLASAEARAIANMAWKDDAHQAELGRYGIELELNKAIASKDDEINQTRTDMESALQEASSQFDSFDVDPDQLWGMAMNDLMMGKGYDAQEIQDVVAFWESVASSNPEAMYDYETFATMLYRTVNEENLARLGLLGTFDGVMEILQGIAGNADDVRAVEAGEMLKQLDNALNQNLSHDALANVVASFARPHLYREGGMFDGFEILDLSEFNMHDIDWDALTTSDEPLYQTMLDLWGHHRDFRDNFSNYVQPVTSAYSGTGPAPNNYANRNHPDYVYRRETVAPHFAAMLQSMFPGVEIGALGYIRDPDDVGNGRVTNSDHQSGGAIDVYFKNGEAASSDAMLMQIASWARQYPDIFSSVVYEQNSAHRKPGTDQGHVHLSFRLGYRVA